MKLQATPPEKKTVAMTQKECVKQAHYKTIDTGRRQIVDIVAQDGTRTTEERPITEKVFIPALFEDKQITAEFWQVKTQLLNGDWETHEFATEEDANAYYRGL